LALLQRRLWPSLRGRVQGQAPDANDDIFHEAVCEDWGRRPGFSTRLFLGDTITTALCVAADHGGIGCGLDVAWITAVIGTMFGSSQSSAAST